MKKLFLAILLITTVSSGIVKGQAALLVLIFGEKAATENFFFSLKAGVNYSMITNVEEGNNRAGFNFGLVNNIKLTEKFFLLPEFIALSPRGVQDIPTLSTGIPELDDLLGNPEFTDRKLNYIDIPLLIKYHITDRWSVSAGPQVSFLVSAVDIYRSTPIEGITLKTELDIEEAFKTVDLAAVIDLTFVVSEPVNGKGFNLFARYGRGFIDILKENDGDPFHNSTFQFGATFPFVEKPE
ncbi:MAG: hypothetical protein DRI98_09300 [Bacteroidetes bacterium]|nr:MAG: hypothetical protein DRI98_09300 [Bacteroidota bacterium]